MSLVSRRAPSTSGTTRRGGGSSSGTVSPSGPTISSESSSCRDRHSVRLHKKGTSAFKSQTRDTLDIKHIRSKPESLAGCLKICRVLQNFRTVAP